MDRIPHFQSVSIGVWVNAGSVFETKLNSGISHFIEHMMFKGTERRSAGEIAAEMDAIGANLNAFTGRECTCYHVKALNEDLPLCIDVLSDILLHSLFDESELEKEKRVVLEEIAMSRDNPEDLVFDTAFRMFFSGTPLEREILGSEETVSALDAKSMRGYMGETYIANNMVIAVAGSFDEDLLMDTLEKKFGKVSSGIRKTVPVIDVSPGLTVGASEKDIEQVNSVLVFPGISFNQPEYYSLNVLASILGGGMSSRLFQHIREERGLCYSIYSYPVSFKTTGALCLYVGSTEAQAYDSLLFMLAELDDILRNGITETEFDRCKRQLKRSFILGMESSSAHMNAIGKALLANEEEYSIQETLRRIDDVTQESVHDLIPRVFASGKMTFASVGRLEKLRNGLIEQVEKWHSQTMIKNRQ